MYQLMTELVSRQNYGSGLNYYVVSKHDSEGGKVKIDSSINGITATIPPAGDRGTVTNPLHREQQDWEYCRIRQLGFNMAADEIPYWITLSGEIYTNDTTGFEMVVEICDSGSKSDIDGIGWKLLNVTTTAQPFIVYGYKAYFNSGTGTSLNGYIDFEGPPDKTFYIKNLMIQGGKVAFPMYAKSLEDLMLITDSEADELLSKLS